MRQHGPGVESFGLSDRWKEIDALLREALEQPRPARLCFVRARTASDPDLGRKVTDLLWAGETAAGFLDSPIELDARTWKEVLRSIEKVQKQFRDGGPPCAPDDIEDT